MSSKFKKEKDEFIEDEAEEEDEEDEEDDEDDEGQTRLNKRKKNNFFEEEAEEDDDEEEEDDYDEDYEATAKRKSRQRQQQEYKLEPRKKSKLDFLAKDEDELEAEVEKRYQNADYDDYGNENAMDTQLDKLPSLKDPRLFGVKCKMGMEKEAVRRLMNKYYCLLGTPDELQIISASTVFKSVGHIYIEAYYEAHVRHAIDGIPYLNINKIFVIPLKEMPQVFARTAGDKVDIRQDQYVRIKIGLYKDDLAKVDTIDPETNSVRCILVPRLGSNDTNYQNTRDEEEGDDGQNKGKKKMPGKGRSGFTNEKTRPPQKLVSPDDKMHRDGTDFIDGNKRFRNGYLVKDFQIHQLQTTNVSPTIEELKMFKFLSNFQEEGKEQANTLLSLIDDATGLQQTLNIFQKGDKVRVVRGELVNLIGRVVNVKDNLVRIESLSEDLLDTMDIDPLDLEKFFQKGDHVKVINGKFEGQTGTVLTVQDYVATLISEDMKNEFSVRINDIKISGEVNNITEYQNQYKKHDLIKLNDLKTIGIVISLQKDSCNIVDTEGTIQNVKYQKIERKLNTQRNITQNGKQEIRVNSTIKVIDGINKGRKGVVLHVYRDVLFLSNQEAMHTGGIIVEKANNCLLITTVAFNNTNMVSRFERITAQFGDQVTNSSQQNSKPQTRDKSHELIGKEVSIIRGGWKGYKGIVKDINDKTARIELFSKFKTLSIPRQDIRLASDNTDYTFSNGGKTPIHPRASGTSPFIGASPGWEISPSYDSTINR